MSTVGSILAVSCNSLPQLQARLDRRLLGGCPGLKSETPRHAPRQVGTGGAGLGHPSITTSLETTCCVKNENQSEPTALAESRSVSR